jgi:Arc/MetJ-type ribon-helix-helix transcriptional regulator
MAATYTLNPEIAERIRRFVGNERFPTADAVIERALDALEAEERTRFDELRALVLEGHNSGGREELTEEVWDRIVRNSEERFLRGEKPSPHVCP